MWIRLKRKIANDELLEWVGGEGGREMYVGQSISAEGGILK